MSGPKRTWLTANEFRAEYEKRRAEAIARLQAPKPPAPPADDGLYQTGEGKLFYSHYELETNRFRKVYIECFSRDADGKLVYQLKTGIKYLANKLDSSDYPGTVIYRRPTVQRTAAVPEHAEGAPGNAAGLLNSHISSPDVFNPFDKGHIDFWQGAGLINVVK